ncbi:MAG: DnaA regulatory inactivator Hda [Gammaproteobacteria bacterium]|jgi:DnaA family protein
MQQLPLGVRLRERATFDIFVVSTPNLEAVGRVRDAAQRGGVVWMWGTEGCGRSHLLQAVCAAAPAEVRAGYLPFAELAAAGMPAMAALEGAGALDLLCLDDLDLALGERDFEVALFGVYRALEERRGGIVVAASTPPTARPWALADIGSRFGAAEVFQLRALDEEGQAEALRRRAAARGLDLPEETVRWLLRRFPRDMTQLGRLLDRIDEASLREQRRVTVPFVRTILGDP